MEVTILACTLCWKQSKKIVSAKPVVVDCCDAHAKGLVPSQKVSRTSRATNKTTRPINKTNWDKAQLDKLYAAVKKHPKQHAKFYAASLVKSLGAIRVGLSHLRQAKRVRCVGARKQSHWVVV